jgi:XTP/dITP diphosphohydrolase
MTGEALLRAVEVMDRLRSPGGCPWDAEQTHASLAPYLLEEAYEAYQALEESDTAALRDELGDVLLQVLFHARVAQEEDGGFDIDDVANGLVDKLVRRHPHVFADATGFDTAADVEVSWDELKKAEKAERGQTSVTDGVPLQLPGLTLAAKLQKRGHKAGEPFAARLWDLVREARDAGVDAEAELRRACTAYRAELRSQGL